MSFPKMIGGTGHRVACPSLWLEAAPPLAVDVRPVVAADWMVKHPGLSSSDLHRPISTANSRQPSQHVMFVKSTTVFMKLLLPFYTDFAFLPIAKSNASTDQRHEL
jgi:hypothetical protein